MNKFLVNTQITEKMSEMTLSEKKVARVILSDYPTLGLQPIAKLASLSKVSGPTVLRFVKRLGFDGYQSFQESLLHELSDRKSSFLELYDRRKTGLKDHQLLHHSSSYFQSMLESSFSNLPATEFDQSIALLSDPKRRVLAVGGRFSYNLAQYISLHLHEIRPGVRFAENSPIWLSEQLIDINKKDIIIAFDFRRYQKDTVNFAEKAAANGAAVVLVTDPYLSPIAEFSTCVLPVEVEGPSAFDTFLPAFALVEVLVAGVVEVLGEKARARVKRLEGMHMAFEYNGGPAD